MKIVERGKIDTPDTQINGLIGTSTWIRNGGALLVVWAQASTFSENILLCFKPCLELV